MKSDARILLLAGNGLVGQATCRRLASRGFRVTVCHTGRTAVPNLPQIDQIVMEAKPLPITAFPVSAMEAAKGGVVVHFQCMGALDGEAFKSAFDGVAERLVLISSSDVYRAYGRFIRSETGPLEPTPVAEDAALRERLHPYRDQADGPGDLLYWYDKIEAERALRSASASETTVLRLPKVYGPGGNADLATVYGFAAKPHWRWTHGYLENIAAAIALACRHPAAANEVFNLGEGDTPTMGERLSWLPPRPDYPSAIGEQDFLQDVHTDTSKVRRLLAYDDIIDERSAMRALAHAALGARRD
jgi:nucleoside-diphosphate-sugar epimerase